jgi:hypothetical protein
LLDSVVDGRSGHVGFLRDVRVGGPAGVYLQQVQNAAVEVVKWIIAHDGLFVTGSVSYSLSAHSRRHLKLFVDDPDRSEVSGNSRFDTG